MRGGSPFRTLSLCADMRLSVLRGRLARLTEVSKAGLTLIRSTAPPIPNIRDPVHHLSTPRRRRPPLPMDPDPLIQIPPGDPPSTYSIPLALPFPVDLELVLSTIDRSPAGHTGHLGIVTGQSTQTEQI